MIISFIPARCGSKGIRLKNIKPFCGKPLIYWNLSQLQISPSIEKIIVATDCNQISNIVKNFGFSKVEIYYRNAQNAQDQSSTESVILEYIEQKDYDPNDYFILSQCTSPFTLSADYENGLTQLFSSNAESLLSCVRTKRFLWTKSGKPINYDHYLRPRRQDFDGVLIENGAFYINTIGNILKNRNRLSGKITVLEMPEYSLTEIDGEYDWLVGEEVMKRYVLPKITTQNKKIALKLFLSDVDGVLTDAGMFYSEKGDELKKFCTYDGLAFRKLKESGVQVGIITSENRKLNQARADKLGLDYCFQGITDKLVTVKKLCKKLSISLENVAYIGDDINCKDLLLNVGLAACPANAMDEIKNIPNINKMSKSGGEGVVREFYEFIREKKQPLPNISS